MCIPLYVLSKQNSLQTCTPIYHDLARNNGGAWYHYHDDNLNPKITIRPRLTNIMSLVDQLVVSELPWVKSTY